jgi:hypothetical protein
MDVKACLRIAHNNKKCAIAMTIKKNFRPDNINHL